VNTIAVTPGLGFLPLRMNGYGLRGSEIARTSAGGEEFSG